MLLRLANTILQLERQASVVGKCGSAAGNPILRLENMLLRLKNAMLRLAATGKYASAAS